MKKELIKQSESGFSWYVEDSSGSIGGFEKTLSQARKEIQEWFGFAKEHDDKIVFASIIARKWPAWFKGEPSPEPKSKKIWSYGVEN